MAIEIQLIASMSAAACALCGVFLLVRGMSMTADAITHTVLLGIVLGCFAAGDLGSPLVLIGASLAGLATVWLVELLVRTRLVAEDAATGVAFPLLFAVAVILISRYASSTHLDADAVLLGELAFAPFDRLVIGGVDLGAKGIYTSSAMLLLVVIFVTIFKKELALASFDPVLALVGGFSPALIHYSLMTVVSLTAVGSFEAMGSVLVVAFMSAPAATAYLLTDDLGRMLGLSVLIAVLSALAGYHAAVLLDVTIAGAMAASSGVIFLATLVFAPKRGLLALDRRPRR